MLYLLDANVISDLITLHPRVRQRARHARLKGDSLGLCHPIYYELLRGLYWRGASAKLATLNQQVVPLLTWIPLVDSDWEQAARFWADARRQGRQLSDPDLVLSALAYRLGATLISADNDYDILPITREDWRV
jgi:predicted nucleic acid-binding protein